MFTISHHVSVGLIKSILNEAAFVDKPNSDKLLDYVPVGANYTVIKYFSFSKFCKYIVGKADSTTESEAITLTGKFVPSQRTIREHINTINITYDHRVLLDDYNYKILKKIAQNTKYKDKEYDDYSVDL